jgi:hypothetical protein
MGNQRVAGAAVWICVVLAASGCAAVGDETVTTDDVDADTGWHTAHELVHKDRTDPDPAVFGAMVSYPDRADLAGEGCGPDCASHRHSIITCPGVSYPKVDGIRKDGGFIRHANGDETGDETGLHVGFFFYTCDDFCGERGCSGIDREFEYGIKINVATQKFNFYQSYDSNNCGARHRVDNLNGSFQPELQGASFRVLVMRDGSYRVKEFGEGGRLVASQAISNCTIEGNCNVLCGGGKPACDGACPTDCHAKHGDRVNLYQVGGKVDVHTMKKQGAPYVYWSESSSAGNPSTDLADLVQVHAHGDPVGDCTLDPAMADADPIAWDQEDSGDDGGAGCTPADCATIGQSCAVWPDGCGGSIDCGDCSTSSCGEVCSATLQDACSCSEECCEGQCNDFARCCLLAGTSGCTSDADCCNSSTYGGPNHCDSGGTCCRPVGTSCDSSAECCANHVCSQGTCR